MHRTTLPPATLAWLCWGLGAALYIIGFFQRVAPGVMTSELMHDFNMSATGLGNLSGFYFYSYVAMQIPTGLLADGWGPRRLLTAGALVAGLGSLIFALAGGLLWACLGRLLIGGSVAVAFVAMMKLSSHWMAPRQFSLASGLALLLGIMGGVFAGTPLRLLIAAYNWRTVMLVAALFPFLIAVLIWLVVRDDPAARGYRSHAPLSALPKDRHGGVLSGLRQVLRYRNTWLLTLAPGALVGSVITFAGLWGVPFLTTHYGLSLPAAAAVCSAMLLAWAAGGPICGSLSERIGKRKLPYLVSCSVLIAGWAVVLLWPRLPVPVLVALLIVIGFSAGGIIIGFSFVKESVPLRLAGTAAGVCNMGTMFGPMILQPTVGWILDLQWQGRMAAGARIFELNAYRSGFALMLVWAVVALLCVAATKETACRQQES
ncbi:MFS transporter [Pelobacter seleniigenes]|uniref:MFS transporter n=1 Tax=Pelobacter seleniigenes TaxID=407188 RepID=UPI0004A6C379|nr:MFS transporter [Pelobacter seleniigenes]